MSIRRHVVMDVSHLPTHVFGNRDLMAWATLGFVVIEGFTLLLCVAVYFYLRRNFSEWPPAGTLLPSRVAPTFQVLVMLASLPLMHWISKVAHEHHLEKVRRGLTAAVVFSVTIGALRAWELTQSVNVRWDANAYGSVQWLILGTHGTLLAIQLLEVAGMAAIFWIGPVEKKHFSDASDVAYYWYFIVGAWMPLYVLCFLLPHWI